LSRKAYSNAFQSVEKLLQLQPVVSMKELGVKLGCADVESLASKIFERFVSFLNEIDVYSIFKCCNVTVIKLADH